MIKDSHSYKEKCKDIPYILYPTLLVLTSSITVVQYQNQTIDITINHRAFLDFTDYTLICIFVAVCNFIICIVSYNHHHKVFNCTISKRTPCVIPLIN